MSHDLHVFGAKALETADVRGVVDALGGCRLVGAGGPAGSVVEREVREGFDYCFNVDGPYRVEQEDLPEAVVTGAVGVRWTYQVAAEGSSAPAIQLAGRFARGIAKLCEGVVYDPQQDVIVWPRGGRRKFKPEPSTKIDVVDFEWFVRREDATAELSGIVFDSVRSYLPEALPRRFGSFEPLQRNLDEAGRDGFITAWRGEPMSLFWKGTLPCLGGSMFGLGDELIGERHAGPHPVGSVELSFDQRAFLNGGWREDAVGLFVALCERLSAFFAQAEVRHNVGYSRGNVWYGPDTITNPGLVVRNVWMGLPSFHVWLAWFGGLYLPLVRAYLPDHSEEHGQAGVLVRTGPMPLTSAATEADAHRRRLFTRRSGSRNEGAGWRLPRELVVRATGEPPGGWKRERADVTPDGL